MCRITRASLTRRLARRRADLEAEGGRERATLAAIRTDPWLTFAAAAHVVSLTVRPFEAELTWLREVAAALPAGHEDPD